MKKQFRLALFCVVVLAMLVGIVTPALAADNDQPEIQVVRYFFLANPPIPVGEIVEFVEADGPVIKWEQRIGQGTYTQYFWFQGVDMSFGDPDSRGSITYRNPAAGDIGTVEYYGTDENGVVDWMSIMGLQQWTAEEFTLIQLGNQFYEELVAKNLIYLVYNADCLPSEYFLNGASLQLGLYGNTYKVPPDGGNLQAVYYPGECGGNYGVRWSVHVDPGDAVGGTEDVYVWPLKDQDPWGFCYRLEWMRPVWQPAELSYSMEGVCSDLWGKDDYTTEAVLAREGFQRADSRYGDDIPDGIVPFVWWGKGHGVTLSWPTHIWERVNPSRIVLDTGATYNVTVAYDGWTSDYVPVIQLAGGKYDGDTDVPWYEWNTPLLFVHDLDYYFDWRNVEVFRILRWTRDTAVIEKLVWTNNQ